VSALRIARTILLVLLSAASAPASAGAQAAAANDVMRARVDSLARAFIAQNGAPGISVEVVRGRDTLVRAGFGMADLENDVPASAATLYRIGSITKQFTSAAVMRLVEQGRVALSDSIARYVPGLPDAWRGVTVRELLNHTSGIPSYTDIGERWVRRWGEDMPPDSLVAMTANDSLWFPPGTRWRYDNTGYVVLGMLLDHVTGVPYPTYVEKDLLRPLGLDHTYYCDTRRVLPNRARGYAWDADGWHNARYLSMTQPYSAGALCSTVGDLARWNRLLATGRVVSAASYGEMTTPVGAAKASHYGFGLGVDTLAGQRMVTHGGGINGFITDNAYFPADSLSVTVLTNSGSAKPGELLKNIARVVLGAPLPEALPRVALTAAERQTYAGRYELKTPAGKVLAVTVVAGKAALMARPEGQSPTELIPIGHDAFRPDFDSTVRVTFTVENGHATGFTLVQAGATMQARRVGDTP
jgi:D-alanyl-D-alanine carboxypeptidase